MSNSKGGNLSQPLKKVLINVPGPENLGTYREVSTGVQMLQFKTSGYTLPAINENIKVQLPSPHVHRSVIYKLSNVAPVENVNADFGLTISQRVRKPGVDNDRTTSKQTPYYISKSVTAITITAAELNTIATEISALINADKGWGNKFDYQLPGSPVVARSIIDARITLVDYIAAAAGSFQINNGVLIAVGAEANIGDYVAAINAAVGLAGRVLASLNPAAPTTSIIIDVLDPMIETLRWIPTAAISAEMKDNTAVVRVFDTYDADSAGAFTFASPNGNTTVTVAAEASRNAFVVAANVAVAAAPTVAGRVQFTYAVDADEVVVHAIDKSITDVTFAESGGTLALDAAANTAYDIVYDAAIAEQVGQILLINRWVDTKFEVMFPNGQGTVTEVRPGRFAFLTNAEVQQQFSHIPNLGTLAQEVRAVNQVLAGVDYVKVIFEVTQDHYALDGASHKTGFITQVEVYIPEGEWDPGAGQDVNRRWEAEANDRIMDAGTAENLSDVLALWIA